MMGLTMNIRERIMALDVGTKRVGVAVSALTGSEVQGVRPLLRADAPALWRDLQQIIGDYEVKRIVIGLPLHQDGTESPMARAVRRFATEMKAALQQEIPVEFWDERLSTFEARERMRERGMSQQQRKRSKDTWAAVVILEDYLSQRRSDS